MAGVTIRAVTEENIELARAVTDKDGIAEFPKDKVFPKTSDSKRRIRICSSPTRQLVQRCNLLKPQRIPPAMIPLLHRDRSHAEIITDRNLYRPGHTVKMKGLVRDVTQF